MLKLLRYLKPYWWLILLMIGLTYVQVMTNLALPDYMARIVNEGIVGENLDLIWEIGGNMLLVTVIGAICTIIVGYIASIIGTGFAKTIRQEVFSKVSEFSLTEINKFSIASLITRSTNDIQQVQMVIIMIFRMLIAPPIMGIGAVIKANQTAPSMTWIMGLAVTVLLVVIITMFSVALPKFSLIQKLVDKLNLVSRQNLVGLRVIRAFNTDQFEKEKFDVVNKDLTKLNLFVNRIMVVMQPIMMLIFNLTTIGIVWFGAKLINVGDLQIGDMMAFMQYAMQVIMSFLMISIVFIIVPRASVSANRVAEIIDTKLAVVDPKKPKKINEKMAGIVEFQNVTFTYPGAEVPVIHDISFTAKPGQTTAIIGSTGSGKSTIVSLIPRLFDVTSGQILVGGVDVRELKQNSLHSMIGYIPQKGVLFSGTVDSNIKYGLPNADASEVEAAAQISQATEFIQKLEKKYDDPIAQGGSNVSGGQKQRLAIARAVITKPDIYIFDDSFSALDFTTDAKLRKALDPVTKQSTVIIVAQRIGTIIDADQIIVLEEGNIVGVGKHKELMKSCPVYKEIALSQMSEKELENGQQ